MKHLSPAYFALVMATGIVSIAAWDFGLPVLATGLFAFNLAAYVVLACLTALRSVRYPAPFFADMIDHRIGLDFFTAVAASCIIGNQFLLMARSLATATVFLALGTALWVGLTYTIFTAFTVKQDKPPLEKGLTGAWLIAVVATQSVAVLAALIAVNGRNRFAWSSIWRCRCGCGAACSISGSSPSSSTATVSLPSPRAT